MEALKLLRVILCEVLTEALLLLLPKESVVPYLTVALAVSEVVQVMVAAVEVGVPELTLDMMGE